MAKIIRPTEIFNNGSSSSEFKFLTEDIMMSDKTTNLQSEINNIKGNFNSYYKKTEVDSISQYLSSSIATTNTNLKDNYWKHLTDSHFGSNLSLREVIDKLNGGEVLTFWIDPTTTYGKEIQTNINNDTGKDKIFGICEITKLGFGNVILNVYNYATSRVFLGRYSMTNNVGWSKWTIVGNESSNVLSTPVPNTGINFAQGVSEISTNTASLSIRENIVVLNAYVKTTMSKPSGYQIFSIPSKYAPHRLTGVVFSDTVGGIYSGSIDTSGNFKTNKEMPSGRNYPINITYCRYND